METVFHVTDLEEYKNVKKYALYIESKNVKYDISNTEHARMAEVMGLVQLNQITEKFNRGSSSFEVELKILPPSKLVGYMTDCKEPIVLTREVILFD